MEENISMTTRIRFAFLSILSLAVCACNSSDIKDAIDIADGVPRKTIDVSRLGVNSFANDSRFGSIPSQFGDIKNNLGLRFVRVLFNWDDQVQPGPDATPNFSFDDAIIAGIPSGVDALVVLTGVPSWMSNPANWIDGNPRTTFVRSFVRRVAERYGSNSKIIGFEIWNEPNMNRTDNSILELTNSPENYVEMLARAYNVVKENGGKLVVGTSTTSINQNFPASLDYNKAMQAAGAEQFLDIWGIHFYGKQYERVLFDGGVADFVEGLSRAVWVTESGAQGTNNQLAYGEEVWPFLIDNMPAIDRIYIYQYAEATPAANTYGLRNLDPSAPVSDLYLHLQERNQ